MFELLPIIIIGLVFAGISEKQSKKIVNDSGIVYYEKKDVVFYLIAVVVLATFVGLRKVYNDTGVYIDQYNSIELTGVFPNFLFNDIDWNISSNFGFTIIMRLLKFLHFSDQSFLMFFAFFILGVYFWFIRKYSNNIFLSVFYVITMGIYTFTMGALRQCIAIAICLIAVDCFLTKKYALFVLLVLFAITFHQYAFIFLIVPLLSFSPWTSRTYIVVFLFLIGSFGMQSILEAIDDFTLAMGKTYSTGSFSGKGVNVFRLIVVWIPTALSFILKDKLINDGSRAENLFINLSMINAEIMFLGLFGTANYFARLANFFLIFQTISLPVIIQKYPVAERKFLTTGSIIGYSLYFIYANTIAQGGFDNNYFGISFFDYINNIFV